MNRTFKSISIRDIVDGVHSRSLNPDPISQRPSTSSSHKKSQGIIEALRQNFGVGMVTVRDIGDDIYMQKVYPGVRYLVIDGGHRIRAIYEFFKDKFKVNGSYFRDLTEQEKKEFLSIEIPFESIVCTSIEAINIFRTRNKTTEVNFMEMIMCDDQSAICKEVRSRTKFYREYQNKVHPLFAVVKAQGDEYKPDCFETKINYRRKWDEYILIVMLKIIGGGNVDAGEREIQKLVEGEYEGINPVTKKVLNIVDSFLTDVRNLRIERGRKLNNDIFAALQLVWFSLYEKNPNFKIEDITKFTKRFMKAYGKLTGTSDTSYDNKIVDVGTEDFPELVNLKVYMRAGITNFSNGNQQKICAKFFLKEMGEDIGVVFRDLKRSLTTKEREEMLALQDYKCALDGEPLKLEDSVWGHDVAWAHGGKLFEGKVIRREHNSNMGTLTLDEYRLILDLRKKKILEPA